ncbi:MAG TPA: hypothetical protein VG621_02410 [Candidatus Paceibacterota bacterium]|nr:hypothetical protein [Candidatus Paceibacterota bacterium]
MSIKSFFIKKTLQMKGVSKEQAENIAKQISENPELTKSLKALEDNKEVKTLFETIQKEIEEKKKSGMAEIYAAVSVMEKYKSQIAKYKDDLAPLMQLMGKK